MNDQLERGIRNLFCNTGELSRDEVTSILLGLLERIQHLEQLRPEPEPVACQYAKDVAMPEYRCVGKCQYAQPEQEPVAHTTGHCENHKQKGGCQLHNLQCGWPDCDRKPITTSLQSRSEQAQWDAIPDAFNEWWDADYDDTGNPYRKDSPAYWAWSGWKAASKQPEQEPVAWLYRDLWGVMKLSQTMPPPVGAFPVYATPPQRKPLTDEEISDLWCKVSNTDFVTADTHEFARAIEAKLKERNT